MPWRRKKRSNRDNIIKYAKICHFDIKIILHKRRLRFKRCENKNLLGASLIWLKAAI